MIGYAPIALMITSKRKGVKMGIIEDSVRSITHWQVLIESINKIKKKGTIMKCVKKGTQKIKRVSDSQAMDMVDNKGWDYCPKHEWKAQNKEK